MDPSQAVIRGLRLKIRSDLWTARYQSSTRDATDRIVPRLVRPLLNTHVRPVGELHALRLILDLEDPARRDDAEHHASD